MSEQAIRILIAEDMEPIRKRYVKILSEVEDMEVIADVSSGEEAVIKAELTHPDVILMDIEMESKDAGLRASKILLEKYKDIKIIILTVYEEDELIYTAFQFGVCDYIKKNANSVDIVNSIRNVYLGNAPLRPEIASKILGEFKRVKSYESSFLYAVNLVSSLTSTEMEILNLLLEHKTRREICQIRYVEMSTMKTQIRNILQKFNKRSIEEVVALIYSLNLYDFIKKQTGKN
ncbi:response regulator transcription factor [Anaeromicropila herbilytica]|uniref:Stage 0 sporulation protein A homolog n=1 Tax=Anaeromicropila herbilytica TaxID=2785025 RepID=A0A7R7EL42_9FIRM|nr:response regulator transcription factor [Anaeromicropila herbilytica]BCN30881.1 DNA-binding response regulator [Anaeromicropila herbilytica]